MNITIIKPDFDEKDKYPLYCHYDWQYQAQRAFLEVDCEEGTMSVDYNPDINDATPVNVWEGRAVRFNLSSRMVYEDIDKLLNEAKPIAEKLIASYEGDPYSGGSFDEKAYEELMHLCDVASADADERYYYETAEEEEA